MTSEPPEIGEWSAEARAWLAGQLPPRQATGRFIWGQGSDDVAVFNDLSDDDERSLIAGIMDWQQRKFDAGYGAITWPPEYGGAGLPSAYARAFRREETRFDGPGHHETPNVSINLVGNTIRVSGSEAQRQRFLRPLLRAEILACQLFSEPGAGSDLAGLSTSAVRDGDDWVLNGAKIWSSGARYSDWGEIICRTDPDVAKHEGMTAFLLPMDSPGLEVRPIRQMSGGSSFNEVFLADVRVPDDLRLGDIGAGWKIALTTLGFERGGSGEVRGGTYRDVVELARFLQVTDDAGVRQALARLYTGHQAMAYNSRRAAAKVRSGAPGAEGSIGKLLFTRQQQAIAETVESLLGPRLAADTGEWGTFAWSTFLLGAPGNRIAGGSDEVQHNIIGERVLGLPAEPRVDRDIPFRDVPR
jgi:alkylation response protein AidB-like acyl-CoA dehydrogenase